MESKFLDVHAHLSDNIFDTRLLDLVHQLKDSYLVLNSGENLEQNAKILNCAKTYDFILPCIGLHPNEIARMQHEEAESEFRYISENIRKSFAVSEIGLDYKGKDIYQMEQEREFLHKIMDVAEKNNKVCILHSRKALEDIFDALSSFNIKAVIHNFEGNLRQLGIAQDKGIGISISTGFMRFKRENIVKNVDINCLFTETDSPVLSPDDDVNTPLNLPKLLNYIAGIKGIDMEELKSAVYSNFKRVFYD
jgi:TatD DNase family protein